MKCVCVCVCVCVFCVCNYIKFLSQKTEVNYIFHLDLSGQLHRRVTQSLWFSKLVV